MIPIYTSTTGGTLLDTSKNPAAVELGRLGGLVKSERKARAAKRNARKGGRPKAK